MAAVACCYLVSQAVVDTHFSTVGNKERDYLQRLQRDQIQVMSSEILVIASGRGVDEEALATPLSKTSISAASALY